ncbi:NitT/TauT family transport system permease protein [Bradyrhizobium sp. AZCC 2262]|uniref:ABC transporter permease n=1 Tax=Bradyrhizobium sp. AZCC 2262 TaxID=3117022 RepID=UPI002FF1D502
MSLPKRIFGAAAPFATVVVLLVGWQIVVVSSSLPSHVLPSPWLVATRFYAGLVRGDLLTSLYWTLVTAVCGYLIATIVALAIAGVLSESQILDALAYPLFSGFQAIPKVAMAPLLLIWTGYGIVSEIILVALIVFFPIFSSALTGFKGIDSRLVDLLRTFNASRWFKFWHLALPAAAGQIFAGLQIAVGFSLIGCVVVEFLVGTQGIGFLIQDSANHLDTASGVAAMVLLAFIGASAGLAIRRLRQRLIFWEPTEGRRLSVARADQ